MSFFSELFKPAWQSKNEKKALRAVEKMRDQAKLEQVARESPSKWVKIAAIKKLTNQSLVAAFALVDDYGLSSEAIKRLTDQALLTEVGRKSKSVDICYAVAEKIADRSFAQNLYAQLAKENTNTQSEHTMLLAIDKLTNQDLLFDVAMNTSLKRQSAATEKLTDQSKLAEVAKVDSQHGSTAVKMLTDHTMIIDVARNAKTATTCWQAIEKLTDEEILADIAKWHRVGWVSKDIVNKKLNNENLLADVAKFAPHDEVRIAAVRKLMNSTLEQEVYTHIAKNDNSYENRISAAEKLTDKLFAQKIYAEIAKNSEIDDIYTRMMSVDNLTDKSVLNEIANSEEVEKYSGIWKVGPRWTPTHYETSSKEYDIDLREKARERLAKLK